MENWKAVRKAASGVNQENADSQITEPRNKKLRFEYEKLQCSYESIDRFAYLPNRNHKWIVCI